MSDRTKRLAWLGVGITIGMYLTGCAGGGGTTSGLEASERYVAERSQQSRPAPATGQADQTVRRTGRSEAFAMVAGSEVSWDEVRPLLAEAAGGIVLEEVALETMLRAELRERGLALTDAMLERERLLLRETLATDDAARNADESQRLLDGVRRRRGLGPERFESLVRRSAMLRALVQERVVVDEASVERAYRIRYEPTRRVRIITTDTVAEAERARARIEAGESFSRIAAEVSTDPSSVRGGVVEPISTADPSYPDAIRRVLGRMSVGEMSTPIALDVDGQLQVALVVLDEIVEPERSATLAEVRAELERLVRLREERLLMEALSRQLLAQARVTPVDAAAAWSWDSRRGG
jgi:hypothetical protein